MALTNQLTKNTYFDSDLSSVNGIAESQEIYHNEETANRCNVLSERQIGTNEDTMSPLVKGGKTNER